MRIIITEEQERKLIGYLLKEERMYPVEPEKVLLVKNYLDRFFIHEPKAINNSDGNMVEDEAVYYKNPTNGEKMEEPVLSWKEVFYKLEANCPIYSDKVRRTKFLQLVIRCWAGDSISPYGMLPTNRY